MSAEQQLQNKIATFVHIRRPSWQFMAEDDLLRILTNQFVVDWNIITQIITNNNIELREVLSHAVHGIVITFDLRLEKV